MAHPWDYVAPDDPGDDRQEALLAAIGLLVQEWSRLENSLSYLHAAMLGSPRQVEAIRDYGEAGVFNKRLDRLCEAARSHFIRAPCPRNEGVFDAIIANARGLALRRNEIIHGQIAKGRIFKRYTLTQPDYNVGKGAAGPQARYAYTSSTINEVALKVATLENQVDVFSDPFFP